MTRCSADRKGRIEAWNPAAERLFGHTAAEALSESYDMLIPEDRLDAYRATFAQVLAGEVAAAETVRRHKNGDPIEVSVTMSPIVDSTGAVVGVSKVMRDITTQKKLQSSLREAEERLHHIQKMEAIGAARRWHRTRLQQHPLGDSHALAHGRGIAAVGGLTRRRGDRGGTCDPRGGRARRNADSPAARILAPSGARATRRRSGRIITSLETMLRRLLGEQITLVTSSRTVGNALII